MISRIIIVNGTGRNCMIKRISTAFTQYKNKISRFAESIFILGERTKEEVTEESRRAVRHMKRMYQYDWYVDFKSQFEQDWDHHPEILQFMSGVDVKSLNNEESKKNFLESFHQLLENLKWT